MASAPRLFSHLDTPDPIHPTTPHLGATPRAADHVFQQLLETIRTEIIGANDAFVSPYGLRPIVYADYVASGRALSFIENYIQTEVLPIYGNTHTTSSSTGIQTTLFRSEARNIIKQSVNASKDDVVLFTGSGATAAINVLVKILAVGHRHLVILGPYEHHSNILPWRETGATIVTIREDPSSSGNGIDIDHLEAVLNTRKKDFNTVIGAFSGASNITGILSDTAAISEVLNRHGALSVFDMACAGPYVPVDMNPGHDPRFIKHAVTLSTHKLIGGVSSPGILIIKASLLQNPLPNLPGGGTVFFVTAERHRYLANFTEREEGGTPDIIGSVRAAMAFDLRNALNIERIHSREMEICVYVKSRWMHHESLVLLGDLCAPRLPIFSFMIRSPNHAHFLHFGFVASLLNDLFGISSRGGCACAGPYAQRLMGIDLPTADLFESILLNKIEVARPGFVRLNFPYFESQEAIDYIIDAVLFVAEQGWKFLPDYAYLVDTGEWRHRSVLTKALNRRWLRHTSYSSGNFAYVSQRRTIDEFKFKEYMDLADTILTNSVQSYPRYLSDAFQNLSSEAQSLRWFMVPAEALQLLQNPLYADPPTISISIDPSRYDSYWKQLVSEPDHDTLSNVSVSPVYDEGVSGAEDDSVDRTEMPNDVCETCPAQPRPTCSNCYHIHELNSSQCLSCECVDYRLDAPVDSKLSRHLLDKLVRLTTHAVSEFDMFNMHHTPAEPDRLLVAVSGGKDSLTLVSILIEIRRRSPYKFDIGACTVDPMTPEYDPSPLKAYFEHLGIPYYYQQQPIIESAKTCMRRDSSNRQSICSFCARMKRGILYSTARAHGYNILCMGQHLDDLAESFLMSAFYNGACCTMKANYHTAEGDLRIIRPLVYVRERLTREYAKIAQLPIIFENCPACFEAPKERQRVKVLLAAQEHIHPHLFSSLSRAMKPLMSRENRAYNTAD